MWVWEYPLEDDQHHDLYLDPGEQIRSGENYIPRDCVFIFIKST